MRFQLFNFQTYSLYQITLELSKRTYIPNMHKLGLVTFAKGLDLARPCKTQWVEIFSLEVFYLNAHDIS